MIAKTSVAIGKTGNVNGSIDAEHLMVSGELMGNCTCNVVEIMPQGRIDGSIVAKELIIEKGGEFVGQSVVHKNNEYNSGYNNLSVKTKTPQSITLQQKSEDGVAK